MILPTNFVPVPAWSKRCGITVVLISELQQRTASFKFRAAWNLVSNVDAEHFLAASSGNFGQALACACKLHKKGCTIVMPHNSAQVKIDAVRSHGAQVELIETKKISRAQRVAEIAKEHPAYYVASAYDCEFVIAGNASLGREIAASAFDLDVVLAPVGGGGLSSGIIQGLCAAEGKQPVVWGAEPLLANDAVRSLQLGQLVRNQHEPQTIADGARTVSLGHRNWAIIKAHIGRIVEVSEDSIRQAMRDLATIGMRVEPTGALTVGALFSNIEALQGKRVGCVLSGANVDPEFYDLCLSDRPLVST